MPYPKIRSLMAWHTLICLGELFNGRVSPSITIYRMLRSRRSRKHFNTKDKKRFSFCKTIVTRTKIIPPNLSKSSVLEEDSWCVRFRGLFVSTFHKTLKFSIKYWLLLHCSRRTFATFFSFQFGHKNSTLKDLQDYKITQIKFLLMAGPCRI